MHTHVQTHISKIQNAVSGKYSHFPPPYLSPLKPFNSSNKYPGKWLAEEDPTQHNNNKHRTHLPPSQAALSWVKVKTSINATPTLASNRKHPCQKALDFQENMTQQHQTTAMPAHVWSCQQAKPGVTCSLLSLPETRSECDILHRAPDSPCPAQWPMFLDYFLLIHFNV